MPDFEVVLEPSGQRFAASSDEPLLTAALRAGLDAPSSCRTGTCRTCMQQLTAGRVTYRIEWPGLAPDEKADGWILPCVAYPASDLRLHESTQRPWWVKG